MRDILVRVLKLLSLSIICVACFADNLTYLRIDRSVIEKRIQTVPATDTDRVSTIRAQFKAAGCPSDQLQEQAVPGEELPNMICILPGPDPGAIVIATRMDSKSHGEEALVDWGGPVMLPLLAESLNAVPHRVTLIFAAFAGHDHGFAGANWYLKQLTSDQRTQIRAMIQLDKVGRTPAAYAYPGPDTSRMASVGKSPVLKETAHEPTTLSKVLPIAARSLKSPEEPKEINDIPATEARAFEEANIPAIVIHSVSYTVITPPGKFEQVRLIRTALDPQIYTDTYNLMSVYVLYLDKVYSLARARALATQTAQATTVPADGSTVPAVQSGAAVTSPASASAKATLAASQPAPITGAARDHLQQPPPQAEGSPTNPVFRTTTRLVQVDVVVTDKQGRPIPGLSQSDFTVMQDGKPQQLRVFEPHTGSALAQGSANSAASVPKLPPHTYSNHPDSATADAWTIVLFDLLNTPTTNQEYARKQLLDMLHNAPKGRPIALYLLTNRLVMVQGFTDEPDKLLKAAENLQPGRSHVLTTEAERQHSEGQIAYAAAELTASAPSSSEGSTIMTQMTQGRQQQTSDLETFQIGDRANFTLAAFESLSRAVSGYPGRKNLIWLSASFPVQIMADPKLDTQPWRNTANFKSALATAGSLLAKSRIAVYPVDVRGLQGRGVDISNSATEAGLYTSSQNSANYGDLLATQAATYADERSTMKMVAEQTGGEAFLGTNNLRRAMERSMDDGSTYYTLAYTPDKVDPQTVFHRIGVKVDKPDVKLAYRRGYYSSPPKPASTETGTAALRGALQPGMPQSTMLFLMASVLPPDATHKNVRIQYIVNPNGVTFTDAPDQSKQLVLDCIAVAYDNDGKEVGHASDTLDGTIKAAAYDTVMNNGIPAQQEITLPPGAYNLRLGVMDRPTQQIGTVDVPLVVPDVTTAKQ
jgi:VWFA-related protein